ncbi:MAG: SMC family ATPase [Candidatus Coatesbacteria bacterium]|nr:MAG: SMC family ATPase [Candidatus Coatesbacteria bacterium]
MIPLYLKPENFLSYGEGLASLDFSACSVACLSGRNGAGKSALLDAFTWALWGKARGDHDQLVRRGAYRMSVELGFEAGGTEYRVVRTYDKTKRRHDVYLHERDDEGYVLVAEKPREVAKQIERIVGLDYDVFLASSYLRQGDADHFVKLPKRERKDVLYEILGLNRVLALGDAAKAASGEISTELGFAERELEAVSEVLKTEPEAKARRAAAEKTDREAAEAADEVRRRLEEARSRAERFRALTADLKRADAKLESSKKEITGAEKAVEKFRIEITEAENVTARKVEIETAYGKCKAADGRLQKLEDAFRRRKELEEKAAVIEVTAADRREAARREKAGKEAELKAAEERLAEIRVVLKKAKEVEAGYGEYQRASSLVKELETKAEEDRKLERDIGEVKAALDSRVAALRAELESVEKRLGELGDPGARLADAEAERDKVSDALEKAESEVERLNGFNREVDTMAARVENARARADEASAAVRDLDARVGAVASEEVEECPTCERPFDAESRLAATKVLKTELEAERARQAEAEDEASELGKYAEKLAAEVKALAAIEPRAKADELRSALGRLEKELEAARAEVEKQKKLTEERANVEKSIKREKADGEFAEKLAALTQERAELGFTSEALEKARADEKRLSEFDGWKRDLELAEKTAAATEGKIERTEAALAELEKKLAGDFLADGERGKLEDLRSKAEAIEYDPKEREDVAAEVKRLAGAEDRHRDLVKAEAELKGLRESERLAAEKAARLAADVEETSVAINKTTEELKGLEGVEEALTEAEKAAAAADDRRLAARDELAAAAEAVKALERAKERKKEIEEGTGEKQKARRIYDYLTGAFGRNGIPALMLGRGLAELEDLANELLARLTDGRFTMTLETETLKKSGEGVIDTLEVNVSDGGAPRSYELFSGGEAFRCDFALRVGLAKLLSRRVGVPLRFLILDEGFGTQDPEGLDAVVDCINEISADFEKILVISHLPELRDRFGTRVEITKDAGGVSRYEVVG